MIIESTPVSGVEIKKAEVAAFEAPFFLSVTAVGITEHEHRGSGTPTKEAFSTEKRFFFPKCLRIHSTGMRMWIIPDNKMPRSKYGEVRFR
jgi:hypothetical protein